MLGNFCDDCEALEPQHGHLNKVSHLTAKFAKGMFLRNTEDSKSAERWGRRSVGMRESPTST